MGLILLKYSSLHCPSKLFPLDAGKQNFGHCRKDRRLAWFSCMLLCNPVRAKAKHFSINSKRASLFKFLFKFFCALQLKTHLNYVLKSGSYYLLKTHHICFRPTKTNAVYGNIHTMFREKRKISRVYWSVVLFIVTSS